VTPGRKNKTERAHARVQTGYKHDAKAYQRITKKPQAKNASGLPACTGNK